MPFCVYYVDISVFYVFTFVVPCKVFTEKCALQNRFYVQMETKLYYGPRKGRMTVQYIFTKVCL